MTNLDILKALRSGDLRARCFTGHRPNKLGGYKPNPVRKHVIEHLIEAIIQSINEGAEWFITGMAQGVDQIAALLVLHLRDQFEEYSHIKLLAAVPCKGQQLVWREEDQATWQSIIDRCDLVHYVSEEEYTNWCMQDRNEWMVDHVEGVIAVWDGTKGGTRNCIMYAMRLGIPIVRIHPRNKGLTHMG